MSAISVPDCGDCSMHGVSHLPTCTCMIIITDRLRLIVIIISTVLNVFH